MKWMVPDAGKAWQWASMRIAALSVAFGLLPLDQQIGVVTAIGIPIERVPAIIGVAVLVGRLFRKPQPGDSP